MTDTNTAAELSACPPSAEGPHAEATQALAVIRVEAPTPAVRAPRELRVTNDAFAVLDTAKFEHMQRVAEIMAVSNLTPETLVGERKGDEFFPFSREVARANCFMVVDFAVTARASPFAVAQAVSVVRGKLMFEGKLIHAILEGRYGIALRYRFNDAQGDALGVTASATVDGELLEVSGTVGDWKTDRSGSPWKSPANHPRMLRYRSAREWARAYQPGAILGVYSDDEVEDMVDRRERIADARPGAQAVAEPGVRRLTGGFPDAQDLGTGRIGGNPAVSTAVSTSDAAPARADPGQAGSAMAERMVEAADAAAAAGTATLKAAEDAPDTVRGEAEAAGAVVADPAPTAEEAPKRKRGRPSNAEKAAREAEAAAAARAEGVHAEPHLGEAGPATGGAPAVASTPASSGSATDASPATPDPAASGPTHVDEPSPAGEALPSVEALQGEAATGEHIAPDAALAALDDMAAADAAADDSFPGDKVIAEREERDAAPKVEQAPAPAEAEAPDAAARRATFARYSDTVEAATTWAAVVAALKTLAVTDAWKTSEPEAQRMARLDAWDRLGQLIDGGEEAGFLWKLDIQAVKVWLDTDPSSEEIAGVWAGLREAASYTAMPPASQTGYAQAIADALKAARAREAAKAGA